MYCLVILKLITLFVDKLVKSIFRQNLSFFVFSFCREGSLDNWKLPIEDLTIDNLWKTTSTLNYFTKILCCRCARTRKTHLSPQPKRAPSLPQIWTEMRGRKAAEAKLSHQPHSWREPSQKRKPSSVEKFSGEPPNLEQGGDCENLEPGGNLREGEQLVNFQQQQQQYRGQG